MSMSLLSTRQREILRRCLELLGPLGLAEKSGPATPDNLAEEVGRRWPELKGDKTAMRFVTEVRTILERAGLSQNGSMVSLNERDDAGFKTDTGLTVGLHKQPGSSFSMSDAEFDNLVRQYNQLFPETPMALSHEAPPPSREALLAEALLAGKPIPASAREGVPERLNRFGLEGSPAMMSLSIESEFVGEGLKRRPERAQALADALLSASGGAR